MMSGSELVLSQASVQARVPCSHQFGLLKVFQQADMQTRKLTQ